MVERTESIATARKSILKSVCLKYLKILYIFRLCMEKPCHSEPILANMERLIQIYIQNLQILQTNIVRILQYFATKLSFKILFLAVAIEIIIINKMKIYFKRGMVHTSR